MQYDKYYIKNSENNIYQLYERLYRIDVEDILVFQGSLEEINAWLELYNKGLIS